MTVRLRVCRQGQTARLCGMEVESIEPYPSVSRVPGSPFGMALVRSQIVPVMRLGNAATCLIVGRVRGEVFGIVGLQVMELEPENSAVDGSLADWQPREAPSEGVIELDIERLLDEMKAQQRQISQLS